MAGIEKTTQNLRKCLRPTEILKSNTIVERLVKTMRDQFTSPFNSALEKDKLYNLVSGRPVSEEIAKSLLSVKDEGAKLYEGFRKRLVGGEKIKFFDPIHRN